MGALTIPGVARADCRISDAPYSGRMNYHYTTAVHLAFILQSGVLKPSRREAHGSHTEGLLWFSTNTSQERTAYKRVAHPVRIASRDPGIQPWRRVAKRVGFTSGTMRRLEASGRKMGAIPGEWQAMTGPIALSTVEAIELRLGGRWQTLNPAVLRAEQDGDSAVRLFGPGGIAVFAIRKRSEEGFFVYGADSAFYRAENLLERRDP